MPSFKSIEEYNRHIGKKDVSRKAIDVTPNTSASGKEEIAPIASLDECKTKEDVKAFAESKGLDLKFQNRGVDKMKEMVQESLGE